MKTIIMLSFTIFLCILLWGCDPTYTIDYKIENRSEGQIQILVNNPGISFDTNIISSHTTLIFFTDFGIGYTATDYLDRLEELPVGLYILNKSGIPSNKNVEDISNWKKYYPDKKSDGYGMVQLTVYTEDFQ
jgi:hypothetical protein